jgi:hypothetical protein
VGHFERTSTNFWSLRNVYVSSSSSGISISSPSARLSGGIAAWIISTTCSIFEEGSLWIRAIRAFFSSNVNGFWAASLEMKKYIKIIHED